MTSNSTTCCPLDCFDSCRVIYDNGVLKGDKNHPYTHGHLCPNLNAFLKTPRIEKARYQGKEIALDEAVQILIDALKQSDASKVLYYRSAGNQGFMQESPYLFFSQHGAYGTHGGLCCDAGFAAIDEGRGVNYALDAAQVEKSEVVILWGRNVHHTNSHMLRYLKGKTVIVIDPYKTEAAKHAALHIQLKPHGDAALALLLSRFLILEDREDQVFLKNHTEGFEDFMELVQHVRIKKTLAEIDVSLGQVAEMLHLVEGKRCVVLVGIGPQKYVDGGEAIRAIDSFGAVLGLFGKEGCGVTYLGNRRIGVPYPFDKPKKSVGLVNAPFEKFDIVLFQGANPLCQTPYTNRIESSLSQCGLKVYFGLYENETSQMCDLVLPAKSFLEKRDIRSSYGSNEIFFMPKLLEPEFGISEYELTRILCNAFAYPIESEEYYIDTMAECAQREDDGFRVKERPKIPYSDGFGDRAFEFVDEFEDCFDYENDLFLLTSKPNKGLNSQFKRGKYVYVNPSLKIQEGADVEVSSSIGSVTLQAKHDENLRDDCILIFSGTPGVNKLTSSQESIYGKSTVYQELKVKVTQC